MSEDILPQHVAIIMDGNGRWAKQRKRPRTFGHKAGVESLRKTIKFAAARGISVLSVFAFSTENWNRPKLEVTTLMRLFLSALKNEVAKLHENNIRLKVIGELDRFSTKIQEQIAKAENLTANNTGMTLVIAANYGGRWDITQAMQKLAKQVQQGQLQWQDIDESKIAAQLTTAALPEPDLFIRTSGEERISNFFLWQLAYTELYFSDAFWPDFDEAEFEKALIAFKRRERRFGLEKAIDKDVENA